MADTDRQEVLNDPIPGAPDDYRLANYAGVKDDAVQWLWYPYIPGMITMVQRYPGSGKSSMLLDIIMKRLRTMRKEV
jgi:hypothetical protein